MVIGWCTLLPEMLGASGNNLLFDATGETKDKQIQDYYYQCNQCTGCNTKISHLLDIELCNQLNIPFDHINYLPKGIISTKLISTMIG